MSDVLLVTTSNYNLQQIRSVKSFMNIDWSGVSSLIFHSTIDGDLDIIKELTGLKEKVDKVIYINSKINPLYYCIFTGLDADIYDSEEYLADEETLMFLVQEYKETGLTMKSADSDLDTLAKSIATISSSSLDGLQKLLSNEYWTRTLTTAVSNIDHTLARANQININVVDMLSESNKLIKELEESNGKTTEEISKLNNIIIDMERKNKPSTPFIFSSYTVPVNVPNVLHIKVYGQCRYLNSFTLAYQHYLKMSKQINAKVLFIMPKLKLLMQKYREVGTRLAPDSINIVDFHGSPVFITFEPKKQVMDSFFNQKGVQVFIVIDLMFGDKLVEGHMVKDVYGVGSMSDISKFDLKPDKCIIPISGSKSNIHIPHIRSYTKANSSTRRSMYFETCAPQFTTLDNILKLR